MSSNSPNGTIQPTVMGPPGANGSAGTYASASITAVNITTGGYGYIGGGGGGYANLTINSGVSTGLYTTSSTSYSPVMTIQHNDADNSDVIIKRPNGVEIPVGKSIELILDHLKLILPNKRELEENPALKLAYDNYLQVLETVRHSQEIKDAYDSYQMVRKLSKDDD